MRTAAKVFGYRFAGAATAFAVLAVAGGASGQEVAPMGMRVEAPSGYLTVMSDRPRLGVYLRPGCDVGTAASGRCDAPPVVASVVEGAPAAIAGLQPGDTLLALDGVELRSEAARRKLSELEEGVPVRLRVGRGPGRLTVDVTPTARPVTGLFRLDGTTWTAGPRSDVQVFRMQDDEGGMAEFYFSPPSGSPPSPDGFVMFGQGEDGVLKLEFGRPDVEVRTPDGRQLQLAELESHFRALDVTRPGETPRPPEGVQAYTIEVEVESDGASRDVKRRVILENAPLAHRLQTVHSRALSDARVRIDSVRQVQAQLARRGELPPAAAASYSSVVPGTHSRVAAPVSPRWSEAGLASAEYRLAGAEFRALTPELAEYFPVAEGLLVLRVIPETPAHRLGLRGGDVVIEIGGREATDIMTFRRLVAESQVLPAGVRVKWNRKGREMSGELVSR